MQENELYALLSAWVDETGPAPGELDLGYPNEGRKVRTNELFKELEKLAEEQGFRFHLPSPVALGRQLQELESTLEETFQVERGQDRKGSWWAFRRREDAS
ncbi:MAG: hypothetical protein HY533_03495 [Chloroflexi bacterium]|nr:hypothetical protein [Chloroflexota bacterium]